MQQISASVIWDDLKPRIDALIATRISASGVRSAGASGGAVSAHALSGALHTGLLDDGQAPQFLLRSGGRSLTGDLAVDSGFTVDGVDISAHAANANAHHNAATAGDGISVVSQIVSLASSVAGGGLGYAAGVVSVGAGLGITVNSDDVALASSVAGPGLGYAAGVLSVGVANTGATGLSVEADQVRLTSSSAPGAAASVLATDASGYLTLVRLSATDRLRTPLIDTASGDLTLSPVGAVALADGKTIRSDNFAAGFTGNGWRIAEASGVTDAEFDNLSVRGLMRVYELLIHKIRTGNGSYLFANGGKVSAVSGAGPYTLDFDEDHGLATNDLLLAQKFTGSGTYQSKLTVTGTPTTKQITATLYSGAAPAAGYEYVRIGNSSDANRRGSVYITADDSGAPFVDVVDGVAAHTDWYSATKIKARLGKLDGMTYAGAAITGYGLFSENVYLSGRLRAGGGVARADDDGFAVTVASAYAYDPLNAYTMERANGNTIGGMYGFDNSNFGQIAVRSFTTDAARVAGVGVYAEHADTTSGVVQAQFGADASNGSLGGWGLITATKGQILLSAKLTGVTKEAVLTSTGLTLPSPTGIGSAPSAYGALAVSGRQLILGHVATENYYSLGLEIVSGSGTSPGIGFHRAGVSAIALYERDEKLYTKTSGGDEAIVWTSLTDGALTGLDADRLDGYHASSFALLSGATFSGNVKIPSGDGGLEVNAAGGVKIYTNEINVKDDGHLYLGYRNTAGVRVWGSGEHQIGHAGDTYSYHQVYENSRYRIGCYDTSDGGKLLTLNEVGGNVTIGASDNASELDINGYSIRIRNSATKTGGAAGSVGTICWDSSYIYVCTASNTWKRAALSSF